MLDTIDSITITGEIIVEIHDAKTGKLKSRDVIKNLVVDSGKASIADMIRGNTANNRGMITYAAVGASASAPAGADTRLEAEIARKAISIRTASGKTATFKTFFNQNEANGTIHEIGLFGDNADASPNSGTLFARLNISRTKTSSDTLTLTHGITVG